MSYFSFISFPQELGVLRLLDIKGREKEFGITYDTSRYRKDILLFPDSSPEESFIVLVDNKEVVALDCFKNPFIYEFHVALPREYHFDVRSVDPEKFIEERKKYAVKAWRIRNQARYNFIKKHLAYGQFVEIYGEMLDHVNFNLGPPESECIIELDELLNMAMPTGTDNKHKLTICNYKL